MNTRSIIAFLLPLVHLTYMMALAAPPIEVGIQGGLSMATVSTEAFDYPGSPELSSRIGFGLGVYATIPLTDRLFLQPEIQYVQRGAMMEFLSTSPDTPEYGDVNATFMHDYLVLPLLLRGQIEMGAFSPFLLFGPEVAIRTRAETLVERTGSDPQTYSTENEFSTIDYAIDFGAGVAYHLTPVVSISMSGRYNLGLKDIQELMGQPWKNRGWQALLSVGVEV